MNARAMNARAFGPTLGFAAIAACLFVPPASAHHSFSMFDGEKTVTLNGTVKELEWTNPHSWVHLMVQDEAGKIVEWPLEMQGTGQAMKLGWKPDSVKPGDKISAQIHPLKTGGHGGQLLSVVLPGGQRLGVTGRPASPFGE